ncbi:hypothetical protein CYG48_04895 [Neorhizobium sp. SOG26]|uniref:hypothetical protein n=1 Tax=Neorhizobium sp. SOG26 TaxID=2060726 RepID=UPI000E58EC41|nr:hypothetical protein [Neorhizobium sp. SOG26]AXV15094.1 hypothetical protein CYG48_04895 [Neorhizobium sp. SOG26]
MSTFLWGAVSGAAFAGPFAFLAAVFVFNARANSYQQQEDDEAQVQALLDYQAMTALEREFPIAR